MGSPIRRIPPSYYGIHGDIKYNCLYPFLNKRVSALAPNRILEIGCGNGDFAAGMATLASQVRGLDKSHSAIMAADARHAAPNLNFEEFEWGVQSCSEFHKKFDLIILVLVLVTVSSNELAVQMLADAKDSLSDGGTLMIVDSHPCFRDCSFSTFDMHLSQADYNIDCHSYTVNVYPDSAKRASAAISFEDFHRSLTTMSAIGRKAGLAIARIDEIFEQGNAATPPFMCLEYIAQG